MLQSKVGRFGLGIAALAVAAALIVPAAFGHTGAAKVTIVGNPKAGKAAFSTTCAACHTFKAAGAVGTIGPNLDKVAKPLTEALIIKAITNGGASIMTKAAVAKYTSQMVAYKGTLPSATINNIAAFVYKSLHP